MVLLVIDAIKNIGYILHHNTWETSYMIVVRFIYYFHIRGWSTIVNNIILYKKTTSDSRPKNN